MDGKWRDSEGRVHGERTADGMRIEHQGRVIEIACLPGHIRIRSRNRTSRGHASAETTLPTVPQ